MTLNDKTNNGYIKIQDLSFWYDDEKQKALDNISFEIKKGEFICILGHNGSGKSTLAKILTGLIKPSSGKIIIDGIEISKKTLNEIRKKVGIVFQNPDNQFIATTVEDDIAFGLQNRLVPTNEMQKIVKDVAKQVNVLDLLEKSPENLSGGQKQRVAIASQLALNPDILIFDESTSMLDPRGRKQISEIIKELSKQGKTIITITHFMDESIEADRIIVLQEGKEFISGKPEKVFKKENDLKKIRLKLPFIYELSLELNKKYPKIKPTTKEDELLKQLWKMKK